ncbi:MAG: hypothetical protein WB699_02365 [Bacteroidota bacterium]
MSKAISMPKAKRILTVSWFALGGVIILVVFVQTLTGYYGDKASEAVGWLSANVLPSLSLIIGVLVTDVQGKGTKTKSVERFLFVLTLVLSLAYLLSVTSVILIAPLVQTPSLSLMKTSSLTLGIVQGLVTACLGVFFSRGEPASE